MTQPLPKTDGELLAQFSADHSQAAFTELVNRHGAMVHGVALRVLADHHEAQDVMQAVFLTLARKASALRRSESVGGWLHTVAWRAAMDVQRSRHSRQQREETAMREQPLATPAADPAAGLFRAELDAALNDLPERYRQPVVLFHLEAKSLEETAQRLGLNLKTAGTRLSRAREHLRKKLVRRGVTVGSVGALTVLLSAESGAAVLPSTIVASTVSAATGGAVSTTVAALSKGALNMLFWNSVKTAVLTAACAGVVGTSVVVAQRAVSDSSPAPATKPMPKEVYTEIGRFVEVDAEGQVCIDLEVHRKETSRGTVMASGETVNEKIPAHDEVGRWRWRPEKGEVAALQASAAKYKAGDLVKVFWGRFTKGGQEFALRLAGPTDPMPAEWGAIEKSGCDGTGRDPYLTQSVADWPDFSAELARLRREALAKSGASPLAATGDPGKVFKAIDTTQSGTYGDGKWSYALEIKGDQRQGFLKYDGKNVGDPQPGDYILTPWGWMLWQEQSHWLPVAEKPAKGKQLPDPAK